MCVVTATHPTQPRKAPACTRSVTNHLVLHCRASTSKMEHHAEVRQLDTCKSKKKAGVIVGPALSRVWSFFLSAKTFSDSSFSVTSSCGGIRSPAGCGEIKISCLALSPSRRVRKAVDGPEVRQVSPELKILSFRLALQVAAWAGFHGEGKCKFLSTPRSCTSPCFPPLSSCQHEIALPSVRGGGGRS